MSERVSKVFRETVLGSREDYERRVRADPKEGRGCGKRARGGEEGGRGVTGRGVQGLVGWSLEP